MNRLSTYLKRQNYDRHSTVYAVKSNRALDAVEDHCAYAAIVSLSFSIKSVEEYREWDAYILPIQKSISMTHDDAIHVHDPRISKKLAKQNKNSSECRPKNVWKLFVCAYHDPIDSNRYICIYIGLLRANESDNNIYFHSQTQLSIVPFVISHSINVHRIVLVHVCSVDRRQTDGYGYMSSSSHGSHSQHHVLIADRTQQFESI